MPPLQVTSIAQSLKCVVFKGMQQMSHDHSMFFITICLYIYSCNGKGLEKVADYSAQKSVEFFIRVFIVSSVG